MTDADPETVAMLRAWHEGDRRSLLRLVERDATWIENEIRRRRGRDLQALAETADHFQDLMIEVLEWTPRFLVTSRRQFRALVMRIVENDLVDQARQVHRRRHLQAGHRETLCESRLDLSRGGLRPDAAAARNEELLWMRLGLEFLPDADRRLVEARQFRGEDFVTIAEAAGESANTVRMRFNRALAKLTGLVRRLQSGDLDGLLDAPSNPSLENPAGSKD